MESHVEFAAIVIFLKELQDKCYMIKYLNKNHLFFFSSSLEILTFQTIFKNPTLQLIPSFSLITTEPIINGPFTTTKNRKRKKKI